MSGSKAFLDSFWREASALAVVLEKHAAMGLARGGCGLDWPFFCDPQFVAGLLALARLDFPRLGAPLALPSKWAVPDDVPAIWGGFSAGKAFRGPEIVRALNRMADSILGLRLFSLLNVACNSESRPFSDEGFDAWPYNVALEGFSGEERPDLLFLMREYSELACEAGDVVEYRKEPFIVCDRKFYARGGNPFKPLAGVCKRAADRAAAACGGSLACGDEAAREVQRMYYGESADGCSRFPERFPVSRLLDGWKCADVEEYLNPRKEEAKPVAVAPVAVAAQVQSAVAVNPSVCSEPVADDGQAQAADAPKPKKRRGRGRYVPRGPETYQRQVEKVGLCSVEASDDDDARVYVVKVKGRKDEQFRVTCKKPVDVFEHTLRDWEKGNFYRPPKGWTSYLSKSNPGDGDFYKKHFRFIRDGKGRPVGVEFFP